MLHVCCCCSILLGVYNCHQWVYGICLFVKSKPKVSFLISYHFSFRPKYYIILYPLLVFILAIVYFSSSSSLLAVSHSRQCTLLLLYTLHTIVILSSACDRICSFFLFVFAVRLCLCLCMSRSLLFEIPFTKMCERKARFAAREREKHKE